MKRSEWIPAAILLGIAMAMPAAVQANEKVTTLTCTTNFTFYGHRRGSEERGDCQDGALVDGPALAPIVLDATDEKRPNTGSSQKKPDKEIAVVDAKIYPPNNGLYKVKLFSRAGTRQLPTASTEGYLAANGRELVLNGYIDEVDADPKSECLNSRFVLVSCAIKQK